MMVTHSSRVPTTHHRCRSQASITLSRRGTESAKFLVAGGGSPKPWVEFARDSPLAGGGFELPVPDERGYGLAFVCRVMGFFSARNCSAWRARSGLTPLPAAPSHRPSKAGGAREIHARGAETSRHWRPEPARKTLRSPSLAATLPLLHWRAPRPAVPSARWYANSLHCDRTVYDSLRYRNS